MKRFDVSIIEDLKSRYLNNENIIQYLKSTYGDSCDYTEYIKIAYDLQAGSYSKSFFDNNGEYENYAKSIASVLDDLGAFDRILNVGVGEAITVTCSINNMSHCPKDIFGVDLSWSRIKYAKKFSKSFGIKNINLVTGNIFEMPFLSNSIDVVFSHHSLEPNGGREKEALVELYRVAAKYIVLFEPSYQYGNSEARNRIEKHNYIKNISKHAAELGMNVIENRLFNNERNPLNPTELTIIQKDTKNSRRSESNVLACPVLKTPVHLIDNAYFCKESSLAYPIIQGVPCMLRENAILATHYLEDIFE
jgi:ubiquinone/menaquinone biosynthesis C-methylase UbiE/uncharacterized protein YbaR (Trm112 family)